MQVYKDNDGNKRTPADYGATWLSPERIVELGLTEVNDDYQTPIQVDEKKEKMAKVTDLSKSFNVQLQDIQTRICIATTVNNNTTAAANLQAQAAALKTEYLKNRSVILNG